jgi:hypothetical protein
MACGMELGVSVSTQTVRTRLLTWVKPFRRIPNSPNSHFAEFPIRRNQCYFIEGRGGEGGGEGRGGEGTGVLSHVPDSCDLKPAMQKLIEHPNFQHWLLGYSAPSRRSPMSTFPSPMNLRRLGWSAGQTTYLICHFTDHRPMPVLGRYCISPSVF